MEDFIAELRFDEMPCGLCSLAIRLCARKFSTFSNALGLSGETQRAMDVPVAVAAEDLESRRTLRALDSPITAIRSA
jgi:hypothetical protein